MAAARHEIALRNTYLSPRRACDRPFSIIGWILGRPYWRQGYATVPIGHMLRPHELYRIDRPFR